MFKRFTLLVVYYIREKLVWARKKPSPVSVDAEHDKRIAENYVFDEVQNIYVTHAEYERRARYNKDDYKPTPDEIRRFPNRPLRGLEENNQDYVLAHTTEQIPSIPKLRPPRVPTDWT